MFERFWGGGGKAEDKVTLEQIPIDLISPSPYQCRTNFDDYELEELSLSIKEHGIVQPLILRKVKDGYELVAGERRLRAAKRIGLTEVPGIVSSFSDEEVAMVGLVENLQRSDLHFLEEARGYERILQLFNLTQQELAERIGKSQSTLANKLRLLKLSSTVQEAIYENSISERHSRALLALESETMQLDVIEKIKNDGLTVQETEKFIAKLHSGGDSKKSKQRMVKVLKDLRLFLNSIRYIVDELQSTGTDVILEEKDLGDQYEITILIDKTEKGEKS